MFFEVFSHFFCVNLYKYARFSQLFCNFGGEFCAWCAGKYKHIKNIR